MTAVGAPKENAQAERVIRTLKEEEIDLQEYGSFEEAEREIGRFIEKVYNRKRLHSGWVTGRRVSSRRSSLPAHFTDVCLSGRG